MGSQSEIGVRRLFGTLYLIGPMSLTALMVVASAAYSPWASYADGGWLDSTFTVLLVAALVRHLSLIVSQANKAGMVAYALVHLPVMLFVGSICITVLTDDWL